MSWLKVSSFQWLSLYTYMYVRICLCRWDNRQYLSWLGPIERFYCSPHSRLLSCHLLVPLRLKKGEDSLRFSIPDSKRNSTASADFALAGSGSHIIPLVHASGHPEWPVWHHCTDNSPAHLTTHQIALLYYQYKSPLICGIQSPFFCWVLAYCSDQSMPAALERRYTVGYILVGWLTPG